LHRLANKALTLTPQGEPWGYFALIPGARINPYTRTASSESGKAGKFSQFLSKYPKIHQDLDDWALAKKAINGNIIRGRYFKTIWKAFTEKCEEEGVDTSRDYPFNNSDGGREAVRRYCNSVRKNNFIRGAAAEYGPEAGRLAASASRGWKNSSIPLRPYDEVQLDGHRIDGLFSVHMQAEDGEYYTLLLSRIWLLVLIDCASRAELGYSISLEENYTIDDVLRCITHALVPWRTLVLPSERIGYRPGSGFPSGVIPACAWRAFNAIRFDNAYAQRSPWIQHQIIRHIGAEVITNRGKSPRSDTIVERFMRTFEELTFHKWPNTTGSSCTDVRRENPEKAAERFDINYEDLVFAADLGGATYNAQPHVFLNGRTPLDYLRYRIERNMDLIRKVDFRDENRVPLYYRKYKVTIRGSQKQGHLPYVQFQNSKYTNDCLIHSSNRIGTKAILSINIQDISFGELFDENGMSYGEVFPEARWRNRPYSLATKRALNKLIRKEKISADSMNPIDDYQAYLTERAKLSRRQRNKLLKLQLEVNQKTSREQHSGDLSRRRSRSTARGWVSLSQAYSKD
jgi:putative transposase